jgi:hypothetical protein
MVRKPVVFLVMTAFALFDLSCIVPLGHPQNTKMMSPQEIGPSASRLRIIHVVLKSGKKVSFTAKKPGKVSAAGDAVVGMASQSFEPGPGDIKRVWKDARGTVIRLETPDGRTFEVLSHQETEGRAFYSVYGPIDIPLSEIQQLWAKRSHPARTALAITGLVLLTGSIILGLALESRYHHEQVEESCPFVYAFDGQEFVLDAEPYGAAITEGLRRTDWVKLSNLRAVDGRYRLLLTNELDETQYTDEIKLLVADHAPGIEVAPDLDGRLHTFACPSPPVRAYDSSGRDIRPFVAADDLSFWLSPLEEKDPDVAGDFRDELVFEFPKPGSASTVKLLADLWTTRWGSHSAGVFLGLFGSTLRQAYADADAHGPTYALFQRWMDREELYRLKIWVETPAGWKERGAIFGGAPVVTKPKAYILDIADVPGETLRIMLRPPVNFWMVDALAVDYSPDTPVGITEVAASAAVDRTGRDVRAALAATDGRYLENADRGDSTELSFAAPPVRDGLARTVFVKASGYYRVHIDETAAPRPDLIGRVLGESGFAARYAFHAYRTWEEGLSGGREDFLP